LPKPMFTDMKMFNSGYEVRYDGGSEYEGLQESFR
jgi:hypothetical protein